MKIKILFLLMLLLCMMSVPAFAQSLYGYYLLYTAGDNYLSLNVMSDTGPGYDGEYPMKFMDSYVSIGIYKIQGQDDWDGNTGFYGMDYQAPLSSGEKRIIRNIYLWAGVAAEPKDIRLRSEVLTNLPHSWLLPEGWLVWEECF
jgi:hypothetical protein